MANKTKMTKTTQEKIADAKSALRLLGDPKVSFHEAVKQNLDNVVTLLGELAPRR